MMKAAFAVLPPLPGGEGRGEGVRCPIENSEPLIRRCAPPSPNGRGLVAGLFTAASLLAPSQAFAAGGGDVSPFVFQFSVFVMAIFVGYYVVWSVTPALHTPLMSVTNAISSVIVVGALLAVAVEATDVPGTTTAKIFGFLALVMAAINIFGGFLVTQRMLAMYKKKEKK
jgi:NAD(P) transhydrogenase subunit alpha